MASAGDGREVLNLNRQHLKKVDPAPGNEHYSTLLLDHNEIPRLENVETYCSLIKLSASHNQLVRMYGVARLYSLRSLNLSHNNIVSIEGLKDMKYLQHLNLAGNNIKTIEHLAANTLIEHLDLSDNAISVIPDLSHLKGLRKLHLHANRIKTLQFCDKFLSVGLLSLTLADNGLTDLNEISRLAHLGVTLEVFSLEGNPCCCSAEQHRPFVLNWLPALKLLDDVLVGGRESLVAEWLYSLGKGRQFKPGQHDELLAYLASVRPPEVQPSVAANGEILQMVQQQQLPVATQSPVPQRRSASISSTKRAPVAVRKQISPPKDMCQSLDPSTAHSILGSRPPRPVSATDEPSEHNGNNTEVSTALRRSASAAAGIRKPAYSRSTSQQQQPKATKPLPSSSSKLPVQTKRTSSQLQQQQHHRLEQQQKPPLTEEIQAALTIQKVWRGYQTRNLNPQVNRIKSQLRANRADDHLRHLNSDRLPQHERQLLQLQTQVRDLEQSMQQVLEWINQQQLQSPPVPRPRTLQLTNKSEPEEVNNKPVESFAQGMAHRLIKSVSEPQPASHQQQQS